jgi:hypothetical protein
MELRLPIFNLIFSESTCSGVFKFSYSLFCAHFWVNKPLISPLSPYKIDNRKIDSTNFLAS